MYKRQVYASALGVDVDSLLVSQPDTGEQALEITEALVRSNAIDVIVVDSVAALVPRAEIEGEMGDSHVGLQARLMSQALRKLAGAISKSNCVAIFINQMCIRDSGTGTPNACPWASGPASAVVVDGHAYLVDFGPGVVRRAAEAYRRGEDALRPDLLDTDVYKRQAKPTAA